MSTVKFQPYKSWVAAFLISLSFVSAVSAQQSNDSKAIGVTASGVPAASVAPVDAVAPAGNAALFVGVNNFTEDSSLRSLNFAVNDAIAQAHLFVLELKLIAPNQCTLALSGEASTEEARKQLKDLKDAGVGMVQGTKTSILRSLIRAQSAAEGVGDLLLVSISSHGFEEGGIPYAMPADGMRGALADTALSLQTVEAKLANSKAGKRLLLVDACREKATTDGKDLGLPMTSAFHDALTKAEGQAVLASCDAGQISFEEPELGHGVFTYYLLQGLRGQAKANEQGFITLGTVSDYVASGVKQWVRKNKPGTEQNTAQKPWFKGPKDAENIPFAVEPEIVKERLKVQAESVRLRDSRLASLRSLYLDQKLSLEQYQLGQRLVTANLSELALEDQRQLAEFTNLFNRTLKPDQLGRALEALGFLDKSIVSVVHNSEPQAPNAEVVQLLKTANTEAVQGQSRHAVQLVNRALDIDSKNNVARRLRAQLIATITFKPLLNSIGMKFVEVLPGSFMMGSSAEEVGRQHGEFLHKVTISKGFLIGIVPVTQAQYHAIIGANPSHFVGDENPVEQVSWDDASAFCRALSQKDGKTYRLPTEAEWEYCCRADTSTAYSCGDDPAQLARIAWNSADSQNTTHTVAGLGPNSWGLYDMHGNVWQWCADWKTDYEERTQTDPVGPQEGHARVLRGGAYNFVSKYLRSAYRFSSPPDFRDDSVGFRVVMELAK